MNVPDRPRHRRGRPSSLTHDRIVEAALRLMEHRSFADVSMRDIARALDVSVMTLYNYVSSREQLGELLVDHILRPVRVPTEDEGPWHERIRILERDARQALARHRGISFGTAGVRSTEATRLANGVVSILSASGFAPDDAARAFAVLYTFMLGQIELDTYTDVASEVSEPTFEGITRTTGASFDDLFEFGFDVVLTGLAAVLQKSPEAIDRTSSGSASARVRSLGRPARSDRS